MPYYSRCNVLHGGLYCVRGIGIYPAYIMPVVGRSVALWAVCLASCTHARRVRESVKPSGVAVVRV
nr:MAG TPA: hypothetical protein [Caudoviricetes sp.]